MLKIEEHPGEIILYSPEVNIKIVSNRDVFIHYPLMEYRINFRGINKKIPIGFSREEKEIWMVRLRHKILRAQEETPEEQKPIIEITTNDEGDDDEWN